MGSKISLPGDCRGKKNKNRRRNKVPTRWQDVTDTLTPRRKVRTISMEISLELMEIESQIENIISIDENKRTQEDLKNLEYLIEYKQSKSKELTNPNATSERHN